MNGQHDCIDVKGNPFDIGGQIGSSNLEGIAQMIESTWGQFCSAIQEEVWFGISERSLEVVRVEAPRSFQELQGLSEGSRQDIRKIYLVNGFSDAIDFSIHRSHEDSGCTAVMRHTPPVLYGQTLDFPDTFQQFMRVLDKTYETGVRIVALGDVLSLPYMGLTSNGFSLGINNLSEPHPEKGLTCRVLVNEMLQKGSSEEARAYLAGSTRLSSHCYNLADMDSGVFIEAVPSEMRSFSIGWACEVHTNHYLSGSLQSHETGYSPTSPARLALAKSLLRRDFPLTIDDLEEILKDHRGLCRHEAIRSLGAFVVGWSSGESRFCIGNPCEAHWKTYCIENDPP